MRRLWLAAATAITALTIAVPAAAVASTGHGSAPTRAQAVSAPSRGTVVTLPTGKSVTLPKNWSQMTVSDLAKIGIRPDMKPSTEMAARLAKQGLHLSAHGTPTASVRQPTRSLSVRPMSASGWNDSVYISLTGSLWVVDDWYTLAVDAEPTCTFAVYWWGKSTIYTTSNSVCSGADTTYYSDLGYGFSTLGNVWLCNSWATINGKPCEYVHN